MLGTWTGRDLSRVAGRERKKEKEEKLGRWNDRGD